MSSTPPPERVSVTTVSPVQGLRFYPKVGQWRDRRTNENITSNSVFRLTCQYVTNEAAKPFCVSPYGKETTCACLHILRGEESTIRDNCASAIQHYHEMKDSKEKTCHIIDMKRHADAYTHAVQHVGRGKPHCKFLLPCRLRAGAPAGMVDNESGPHFLCTWGFLRLFAIGRAQWTRLQKSGASWETKLVGNTNSTKRLEEVFTDINTFLLDIKNACRGDADKVQLPPHFKYRKIYERWVLERGWTVKITSKNIGNFSPTSEFSARPNDDDIDYPLWPTGSQRKDVCSFRTFMRYWGKTFPELRIRPEEEEEKKGGMEVGEATLTAPAPASAATVLTYNEVTPKNAALQSSEVGIAMGKFD